jgi:HK97 family phage prohead protease
MAAETDLGERAPAPRPYGNVTYADPKNGKYPIDTAAHAKAAWAYINQPDNAAKYPLNGVTLAEVKNRIMAACRKFGIDISQGNSASDGDWLVRSVPFELSTTADSGSDGLTLEGYAAVFNRKALIKDWDGEFEEQIAPGAFTESLQRKMPVLMFEHGKHPLIGSMPLGVIDPERTREDGKGLFISARLSDNWLIQPVRDAVRDGAVTGMSFRFPSPADEDQKWTRRNGRPDLRTLLRLDVPELGPVVFPAYEPTTAAVRSQLDALDGAYNPEDFTAEDYARSVPDGDRKDAQPGNGGPSAPNPKTLQRDRAWLLRRPLP